MSISAAESLWNARLNHDFLPRDFEGYPTSEDEAYAIQTAMIAHTGLDVIGWKLGATLPSAMETIGVERPFIGPLFADFCYKNGDTVKVYPKEALETEFTIKIKSDIPYRLETYRIEEIKAAIDSIIPSFEIIGCRFDGEIKSSKFRPIADGGANVGCIFGQENSTFNLEALSNNEVILDINGETIATGKPSDLYWDSLFQAVSWLAGQPVMAERGLLAGDLIMTGTMTGMTPLAPGDLATANFGKLGKVSAQFLSG